jgi:signal transduction histidine kinase
MTTRSLAFRLFASAAAWVVGVLLVAGLLLVSYYRHATENAFDERLHVYLKTLVADLASQAVGERTAPGALGEPRFDLPLSGWYWQINRLDTADTNASKSLFEAYLPSLESLDVEVQQGGVREGYFPGPEGRRLRAVERQIDLGEDGRYRVMVAGPADEIDNEIVAFQKALLMTFGFLAVGLVGATVLQVAFGLRPLKRMSATLAAIRAGRAEKLPPDLPDEIVPLAQELDALVDSNRQVVERARTHVGNLAHALKTPLSVIANEAALPEGPSAERLRHQVGVMRTQIDHHLQRARIAAAVSIVGTVTEVAPAVEGLVRAMEKIHHDKAVSITLAVEGTPRFRGERQDLEEMIGNLVDNACKWASSRVVITCRGEERAGKPLVAITISDDGPGLVPEVRSEVARRGRRLDESKPGTGLGLSIVTDLVALYGGEFALTRSEIGGLKASLSLPGVASAQGAGPQSRARIGPTDTDG